METILFILVAAAIAGVLVARAHTREMKRYEDAASHLTGGGSEMLWCVGSDQKTGLALSPDASTIHLLSGASEAIEARSVPYTSLVAVEVFEDGDTITSSARGRTVGGALIGGMLFGGAGAVVGGLSGKKRSTETVSTIELRVTINDIRSPTFDVRFLSSEVKRSGAAYSSASKAARDWQGRLAVLLKRAETADPNLAVREIVTRRIAPVIEPRASRPQRSTKRVYSSSPQKSPAEREALMVKARQLAAERESRGAGHLDVD
ncbi:MAG: hypothetical protein NVV68_06895 [Dokdonella sp.]|nr:hypothetical protein [Dokdonella sp.]